MIQITIDNQNISVSEGKTILEAARSAGIYIPVLCGHPDLPPFHSLQLSDFIYQGSTKNSSEPEGTIDSVKACGICVVEQQGENKPVPSCKTEAADGMVIVTDTGKIREKRRQNLKRHLTNHPHACLTCSQREGCIPLTDSCPNNVSKDERCCALLGRCELQKIVDYVGIAPETPAYRFENRPKISDGPFYNRDYNLCISCGRCVRVCQSVKGVYALGAVIQNGEPVIGTVNGPSLLEAECKFCGSCVEVCPTGAIMDKAKPRLQTEAELIPCISSCPAEVNIPLYLRLIEAGKYQEAGEVNAAKLPLPHVLGKVCFHPCETNCKRGELTGFISDTKEPVSNRALKDFAMSFYQPKPVINRAPATGKKVAIVGSGPAGLTAGYYLALKGHEVTIYEAKKEPGGMLRYGIPRYRLPAESLEKDLKTIIESGIKIKTNTRFGKDITLKTIKENKTDITFLAVGLSKALPLPVPGANLEGVLNGIDFLASVNDNSIKNDYFLSRTVIVIGGGNVATDAARCAIRLKAKKVIIVCLEPRENMPAYSAEITGAEQENIKIETEWGIKQIALVENKQDKFDITLKKCTDVFDKDGNFSPVYDPAITRKLSGDSVIVCIGQRFDPGTTAGFENLTFTKNGTINVNQNTMETDIPGIFAGGDIVSGPASVIEAVGAGRTAAESIDNQLGGDGIIDPDNGNYPDDQMFIGKEENFAYLPRYSEIVADPEIRNQNFQPVEKIYPEKIALLEAHRCLKCDLRVRLSANPDPPGNMEIFSAENIKSAPESAGVIQISDEKKEVFLIKGSENIKQSLEELLDEKKNGVYFTFELDQMYTKRESELMQQYLQKHGELPTGDDDLDDLF